MEKKEFEVWTEGFAVTGARANAQCHGKFKGHSFKDAVENFRSTLKDPSIVDMEKMTFWGCRFFDNESDARGSFG